MMHKIKKVAFLGDSITLGYGLADAQNRFSTVFSASLGIEEVNFGITGTLMARSGTSKTDGTAYIDRKDLIPTDADLVVVYGATNDYFWADTPLADDEKTDDSVFENAVKHLCVGLKEAHKNARIVFILPYQMRGIGNHVGGSHWRDDHTFHITDEQNYMGHTLRDYVESLRKICTEEHIPYLDLYEDFGVDIAHNDDDFQRYTLDGCHPSVDGHKRIATCLEAFCRAQGILS